MKKFKEVESTRKAYHADPSLNSIHRSSLIIPEIAGSTAEVSFLNHFLIKRGYTDVGCRISGIDSNGKRIAAKLFPVNEPRVYNFTLSKLFDKPAAGYILEFFSGQNLFIPYPAVMVNHVGPHNINLVHSYNRILNDIFEDDAVNSVQVHEASIDIRFDSERDTFCVLTAGQTRCQGNLEIELTTAQETFKKTLAMDVTRFNSQEISFKKIFGDQVKACISAVARIRQPVQPLFYGRMLVGQRTLDGAFTANHSYYDSSASPEYWDHQTESHRLYPLLPGAECSVRMYPIMSPGQLQVLARFYNAAGALLGEATLGQLTSPGTQLVEASLTQVMNDLKINTLEAKTVRIIGKPLAGNKTPTRINHQLAYRLSADALEASINVSLVNASNFIPAGKKAMAWGQVIVGGDMDSSLGFTSNDATSDTQELNIIFYTESGEFARRSQKLSTASAWSFVVSEELATELKSQLNGKPQNIWYYATSDRPDLSGYAVTFNRRSKHCSGEHSF